MRFLNKSWIHFCSCNIIIGYVDDITIIYYRSYLYSSKEMEIYLPKETLNVVINTPYEIHIFTNATEIPAYWETTGNIVYHLNSSSSDIANNDI